MNNCIILGVGRSGTSSLAGLLAGSGYYLGENLLQPTINNPKGYFESKDVNILNEDILERNTFTRPPFLGRFFFQDKPVYGQRWLAKIDSKKTIRSDEKTIEKIKLYLDTLNKSQPFAIKDPRFNYTLSIWENLNLTNLKKICVFREPHNTTMSILKFIEESGDTKVLKLNKKHILKIWETQYKFILENHYSNELSRDWLFIHFNQLLDKSAYPRLEKFLNVKIVSNFVDKSLSSHSKVNEVSVVNNLLYDKLCELALYGE